MIEICIDIGNSNVFGGIFKSDKIIANFRCNTSQIGMDDQFGLFLRSFLRENNIDHNDVTKIAFCSVVPSADYHVMLSCQKYFGIDPFILKAGVKTGLKLKIKNPIELGAD